MKIAIIIRAETAERCSGFGCFKALNARKDSFAVYSDNEEIELCGFFHSGGDLDHKIEKMKEKGVELIHLATCMRGKYEDYEALADRLTADFDVIGYSHGGGAGKITQYGSSGWKIYQGREPGASGLGKKMTG